MPFPSSILSCTLADSQQVNGHALPFRAFQLKVLNTYDKAERGIITTLEELAELEGMATEATFILYKTMKDEVTPSLLHWQEELDRLKERFGLLELNRLGYVEVDAPQDHQA